MKRDLLLTSGEGGARVLDVTSIVRTKSGVSFDASGSRWSYRDGVTDVMLDFGALVGTSEVFVETAKAVCGWYAETSSPGHLTNVFYRLLHFVRAISSSRDGDRVISSIRAVDLMNYKAALSSPTAWYLGTVAGFLRRWARLGHTGIEADALHLLKQLRLKGNAKGIAVLTRDPQVGPFSYLELEALEGALNVAYSDGKVTTAEFVLAWLYVLLGQRNSQHAALKVCDVRSALSSNGSRTYSIWIPRSKQGNRDPRDELTERPLIEQFGEVLLRYADMIRQEFAPLLEDSTKAPLFPSHVQSSWSKGYKFHRTAPDIASMLSSTLRRLQVTSERTGQPLNVMATRFRRTIATRAAEEGYGPLVIAKLLDHTDTQNVMVYSANSPAIIERIDRAVALEMAPIAQAFAGILVDGAQQTHDPSKRIIDLRLDRSGNAMGKCGQHSFCGFNAPIACYTCKNFEAWLHGPHEAVLDHLIRERLRLLETTDKRIASINDRTILAVAAVVNRCAEILEKPTGNISV